jgi:hypothetical protein
MGAPDDGGPAFPVPNDANVNGQEGMTLRDYFAAKADGIDAECSALYAEALTGRAKPEGGDLIEWSIFWADADARAKYIQADAMLRARLAPADISR